MDFDIDQLRMWIGREDSASEVLSETLVNQFNATFDRNFNVEPEATAPLLIHFCLAQPTASTKSLGSDGHAARGEFLPPVPLPRRMWAGGAFTFHSDIRVGDEVTRTSTIKDVVLKQGRSGQLCFVTVEHMISSNGRPALTERQDIVYREAARKTGPETAGTSTSKIAPGGENSQQITPTAAYLFRYSAMTFNAHRIHYDRDYVRDVENYPGLIVHGPLQATLLCQYAADVRGKAPASFHFRSYSPLFDTSDFTINATSDGKKLKLWTARPNGPIAMEAHAQW
ncbi:MAG: MaoC family dehydratase N-terminal domain-containing protein [Roseibium sp.]|uniref:FAS1-like dehydratase domain-containing protein n=1 Tax=Roseibium sp. TaxID=1936156 RepID=UPI002622AAA7|nr:MaoC family dehydratase N-terminal domain-containing protein [Roseibium sp.]MCV0428517.1 MaoC family dehydratase N-terminal domain-containing protein [Roseibium sp.]